MKGTEKGRSQIMRGLVIRSPWIEKILSGDKTWEIRGTRTNIRGPIGLIRKGSGYVEGFCELKDVLGPLTHKEMRNNFDKHCITDLKLVTYKKVYAWVISNAKPLKKPIPYKHPQGAVIWVKLSA